MYRRYPCVFLTFSFLSTILDEVGEETEVRSIDKVRIKGGVTEKISRRLLGTQTTNDKK